MGARSTAKASIILIACHAMLAYATACFSQNLSSSAPVQLTAQLAPFSATGTLPLHPAWHLTGLPGKLKVPTSRFEIAKLGGETVLQISTDSSYGVLTHAWQGATPPVIAVAVGADSDNTQGQSLAYLSQLRWLP